MMREQQRTSTHQISEFHNLYKNPDSGYPAAEFLPLYNVFENEAKRIAQRLHDESAQMLAVVYLELAAISQQSPGPMTKRIDRVVSHLDEVCNQLRTFSHELRPLILEQQGVLAALRSLAKGVSQRHAINVSVNSETTIAPDTAMAIVIYRAVQESLANVCRHAHASNVVIRLYSDQENVYCTVTDDGIGIAVNSDGELPCYGLGLVGMQERARAIGGICTIASATDNGIGTIVKMVLPK